MLGLDGIILKKLEPSAAGERSAERPPSQLTHRLSEELHVLAKELDAMLDETAERHPENEKTKRKDSETSKRGGLQTADNRRNIRGLRMKFAVLVLFACCRAAIYRREAA